MRDLPNEVWLHIFSQFEFSSGPSLLAVQFGVGECDGEPGINGLAVLSRICRTSSRFLGLAQPILYRTLPLADHKARAKLLSTLQQYPHLAQHARNVALGDGIFSRDEFTSLVLPHYSGTLRTPSSSPEGLEAEIRGLLDGPEWPEGVPDMWFAHCAALLPNLKVLAYATRNYDRFFPAMISQAANLVARGAVDDAQDADTASRESSLAPRSQRDSGWTSALPQPLSKLEEFCIANEDTELTVSLKNIQELFLLPRLRTFRGWAVALNTNLAREARASEQQQQPQQRSSLRHAHLKYSLANAEGICDLLSTCPLLQTLEISWGSSTVGDSDLDFDQIGRALREHAASLEFLDLDPLSCFSYEYGYWTGNIGNLRPLRRLKHLSLPENILLGSEDTPVSSDDEEDDDDGENAAGADPGSFDGLESLLPESLESLRLHIWRGEDEWVRKTVQGVLASGRLTRLEKVQLDGVATLDVIWDKTGWRCKKSSHRLVFYR
ncbi:hypothetical protein CORC01_09915 [Colletotrichum orchidophilum]|uniref:Uncharacterized protein n=1 Tax=Colletotrichum orchidophilum TaxID=1209926 RepID=A0A1G4B067_9PEZI|nr:uncharacterized protein CORC01_09915 [Colletotrichum orchidophilum]OHE94808.1 hypothetical protein CORC01_09915 [Colletotrichum orchidophilum]